jgi:hypothetical protein
MPPTPVDEHTQDFEQLAGLAALDLLEGDERDQFDRHAAGCERCRLMVRLDREALARAAPEMDPSPGFKARLLQRAQQELAAAQPSRTAPVPLRRPANVIPFRRRTSWLSAVAAVLVVGLLTLGGYSYENQVVATYTLSGSLGGSAVVNVRRSGAAELEMNGVQNPPPGFVYEAWVIPVGGQPIAAGVTPTGQARLPLEHVSPGSTVAITQERSRVDAPTSPPILAVTVPA